MKDFANSAHDRLRMRYIFLLQCPQYTKIRSKYGIIELNRHNNISNDIINKVTNPDSEKDLKSICMYLNEAFHERDHPTVSPILNTIYN